MLDTKLTTRFDQRWPQGMVGRRATRIVKNARLYLATADGQIAQFGWGDLCLEHWHILREITGDGLGLVAFENSHGILPNLHDASEVAGGTLEQLIPGLALALESTSVVLLNHPDPDQPTLGVLSSPALDRQQTRAWLAERFTSLPGSAQHNSPLWSVAESTSPRSRKGWHTQPLR